MKLFQFFSVLWFCAIAIAQSTQVQLNVPDRTALAALTVRTWQTNLIAVTTDDSSEWVFEPGSVLTADGGVILGSTGVSGRWVRASWIRGEPVELDWYAVGDGTTDDRAAILAAANAASSDGKVVRLGLKRYAIGTGASASAYVTLTNIHNGITFEGRGSNSVFALKTGVQPASAMFSLRNVGQVTFKNLTFYGSNAGVPPGTASYSCIYPQEVTKLSVENCWFDSWFDKAITAYGDDGAELSVRNSYFTGIPYQANGTAVYTGSTNLAVRIEGNTFHDLGGWKYSLNLGATPADGNTITCTGETTRTFRASVTDPATEILIGADAGETETNIITHLIAYPFTHGVVSGYLPATIVVVTFDSRVTLACNAASSSVVSVAPVQCIYPTYFKSCVITGNRFIRTGPAATIRFSNGVFDGNYIENDSRMDTSDQVSFNVSVGWDGYHPSPPKDCSITGNRVANSRASYFVALDSSSNNVVLNNVVFAPVGETNSASYTSRFARLTGGQTNIVIAGNVFQATVNSAATPKAAFYVIGTNCYNNVLGYNTWVDVDCFAALSALFDAGSGAFTLNGPQKIITKGNALSAGSQLWYLVGTGFITNATIPGFSLEHPGAGNYPMWVTKAYNPTSANAAPHRSEWVNPLDGSRWDNMTNATAGTGIASTGYWIGDLVGSGDANSASLSVNQGSRFLDRTSGQRSLKTTTSGSASGWMPQALWAGTSTEPSSIFSGMVWQPNNAKTYVSTGAGSNAWSRIDYPVTAALDHQKLLVRTNQVRLLGANVYNTGLYLLGQSSSGVNNVGAVVVEKEIAGVNTILGSLAAGAIMTLPQELGNGIIVSATNVGDGVRVLGNFDYGATSLSRATTPLTAVYCTAPAVTGTAWGPTDSHASGDFITVGNRYRISRSGLLKKVIIARYNSNANLTEFYVRIYRKDAGGLYDLVGTTENLEATMATNIVNTFTIASPFPVQAGDYVGYRFVHAGGSAINTFFCDTSQTGVATYKYNGAPDSDWDLTAGGTTPYSGTAVRIHCYVEPAVISSIGDSLTAGHYSATTGNLTMSEASTNYTVGNLLIPYQYTLGLALGHEVENMGIGSETTTNISARFVADVVNRKPKMVIVNGGINDVANTDTSDPVAVAYYKGGFLSKWTIILDAAAAATPPIKVVALQMWPWTGGTDVDLAVRDDWNAALATLCASYGTNVLCLNLDTTLGKNRASGPAGNLWDIQTTPDYNKDNIHLEDAGYAAAGAAIAVQVKAWAIRHGFVF